MQYGGELYHYGKLGMRWGRHKFQDRYGGLNASGQQRVKQLVNENDKLSTIGRLSPKGIQKKADLEKEYSHLTGRSIADHPAAQKQITKPAKEMSNEELTAYNTRQQLLRTYQSFQPQQQAPQISKGKQFLTAALTKVIMPAATDIGKKWALEKFSELTMTNEAKAERAFTSMYNKETKKSDMATKKALLVKMKYENEDRARVSRERAAGTYKEPVKVKE